MNSWAQLYRGESAKPVWQFVADLKEAGLRSGFLIHNEDKMEMSHTFGSHGVQVGEGFDLHMIQICKPEKAAGSLQKNPERAALMPKFVTVFNVSHSYQKRDIYALKISIPNASKKPAIWMDGGIHAREW